MEIYKCFMHYQDDGDERDCYGNFENALSPDAKRMLLNLAGENKRKTKFIFTDEFLQEVNQKVYSSHCNSIYLYLVS